MTDAAVWVDPGRMSGQPCIHGTRVPTDIVADSYWYYGLEECQLNWGLSREQVVGAVWFESQYGTRRMRRRFGGWAAENQPQLWGPTTHGEPALPPTKEGEGE